MVRYKLYDEEEAYVPVFRSRSSRCTFETMLGYD